MRFQDAKGIDAYVGLGSNLDSPVDQILRAFKALQGLPDTRCIRTSSLYQTKPWGNLQQPDFINAVVHLKTNLDPKILLASLLAIEAQHLRVRKEKNGPRTLDCDLLLYGQEQIQGIELTVPHPEMTKRCFVLVPLAEIAPTLRISGRLITEYCQACLDNDIIKL